MVLEERIYKVRKFLEKYTAGLIDSNKPRQHGVYIQDSELVNILSNFPSISVGLNRGRLDFDDAMIKHTNSRALVEFLQDYQDITISNELIDPEIMLTEVGPDTVLEIGPGQGSAVDHSFDRYRTLSPKIKHVVMIDKSQQELDKFEQIPGLNMSFFMGNVNSYGVTQEGCLPNRSLSESEPFDESVLENADKLAVLGFKICGDGVDHIAKYTHNVGADYFALLRCCYFKMLQRQPMSDFGQVLRFNNGVFDIARVNYDEEKLPDIASQITSLGPDYIKRNPDRNPKNLLSNTSIGRIVRLGVSLDLALYMKEKGYESDIAFHRTVPLVYGKRK